MSLKDLVDGDARHRIRTALDDNLLVEAAAGTGKTHELVQRIVAVLARGAAVDRIAAVTFTRKAAGELKIRLRQALDQARTVAEDPAVRRHLDDALARLEEARIGTIHSFCAEILRERPVEARLDPRFEELPEGEDRRLYDRTFRRFMEERLADLPRGLRRALARPTRRPGDATPMERLAQAGWSLVAWRDYPARWRRDHFDLDKNLEDLSARAHELAALSAPGDERRDPLAQGTACARGFAQWYARAELDGGLTPEALEAELLQLRSQLKDRRNKKKGYGAYAPGVAREAVLEAKDRLQRDLDGFARRADADLAAALQEELGEVVARYQAAKRQLGRVDFVDLLVEVRDLVRGDERVRAFLQARFTHLFVDEYQDTDPLQTEIILLLSADDPAESNWERVRPRPGKLFLVGDPKQSIYRFRRADVVLYQQVRERLTAIGVGLVHLSHSFRATAAIQAAVNLAFEPEMQGDADTGQPGYVPLQGGPEVDAPQPGLVALSVPHPHTATGVRRQAIEKDQPNTVAAFVQWLLQDSGWTVRDAASEGGRRALAARDVCVLFRRFTGFTKDVTRPYVEALEQRSLPHVLVGSRSFFAREEVEALRAAFNAIEWPDDELSVYATLRGPLFALPDDLLLRYRARQPHLDPTRGAPDDLPADLEPVRAALEVLRGLGEARNARPVAETVHRLLDETRAHAGFALRPAGNQVLANIERIVDLARSFELTGGLSFRGFVERINAEAERPRSNEAPAFEEGTEGVRLMTVHNAKGLEFPVVILADITAPLFHSQPSQYVDPARGLFATKLLGAAPWELLDHEEEERARDEAEGVRLAYVAATRARDLLVVPTVGTGRYSVFGRKEASRSWISPLEKVLYPARAGWYRPQDPVGTPSFGERTVLSSAPNAHVPADRSIKPGLHRADDDAPGVVWWDPEALPLDAPRVYGLRQELYLARDDGGEAQASIEAYSAWRRQREAARERGQVRTVDLLRASQTEAEPGELPGFVGVLEVPAQPGRPSGRRFGTLVHEVLRDVDLLAEPDPAQIEALCRMQGRLLGAEAEEIAAAAAPVRAALEHDLVRRARAAARVHREYPVLYTTEDGQRLDGTIDLAFREDHGWSVVDFKTDLDRLAHRAAHERQVGWYVKALGDLTGEEIAGFVLYL